MNMAEEAQYVNMFHYYQQRLFLNVYYLQIYHHVIVLQRDKECSISFDYVYLRKRLGLLIQSMQTVLQ